MCEDVDEDGETKMVTEKLNVQRGSGSSSTAAAVLSEYQQQQQESQARALARLLAPSRGGGSACSGCCCRRSLEEQQQLHNLLPVALPDAPVSYYSSSICGTIHSQPTSTSNNAPQQSPVQETCCCYRGYQAHENDVVNYQVARQSPPTSDSCTTLPTTTTTTTSEASAGRTRQAQIKTSMRSIQIKCKLNHKSNSSYKPNSRTKQTLTMEKCAASRRKLTQELKTKAKSSRITAITTTTTTSHPSLLRSIIVSLLLVQLVTQLSCQEKFDEQEAAESFESYKVNSIPRIKSKAIEAEVETNSENKLDSRIETSISTTTTTTPTKNLSPSSEDSPKLLGNKLNLLEEEKEEAEAEAEEKEQEGNKHNPNSIKRNENKLTQLVQQSSSTFLQPTRAPRSFYSSLVTALVTAPPPYLHQTNSLPPKSFSPPADDYSVVSSSSDSGSSSSSSSSKVVRVPIIKTYRLAEASEEVETFEPPPPTRNNNYSTHDIREPLFRDDDNDKHNNNNPLPAQSHFVNVATQQLVSPISYNNHNQNQTTRHQPVNQHHITTPHSTSIESIVTPSIVYGRSRSQSTGVNDSRQHQHKHQQPTGNTNTNNNNWNRNGRSESSSSPNMQIHQDERQQQTPYSSSPWYATNQLQLYSNSNKHQLVQQQQRQRLVNYKQPQPQQHQPLKMAPSGATEHNYSPQQQINSHNQAREQTLTSSNPSSSTAWSIVTLPYPRSSQPHVSQSQPSHTINQQNEQQHNLALAPSNFGTAGQHQQQQQPYSSSNQWLGTGNGATNLPMTEELGGGSMMFNVAEPSNHQSHQNSYLEAESAGTSGFRTIATNPGQQAETDHSNQQRSYHLNNINNNNRATRSPLQQQQQSINNNQEIAQQVNNNNNQYNVPSGATSIGSFQPVTANSASRGDPGYITINLKTTHEHSDVHGDDRQTGDNMIMNDNNNNNNRNQAYRYRANERELTSGLSGQSNVKPASSSSATTIDEPSHARTPLGAHHSVIQQQQQKNRIPVTNAHLPPQHRESVSGVDHNQVAAAQQINNPTGMSTSIGQHHLRHHNEQQQNTGLPMMRRPYSSIRFTLQQEDPFGSATNGHAFPGQMKTPHLAAAAAAVAAATASMMAAQQHQTSPGENYNEFAQLHHSLTNAANPHELSFVSHQSFLPVSLHPPPTGVEDDDVQANFASATAAFMQAAAAMPASSFVAPAQRPALDGHNNNNNNNNNQFLKKGTAIISAALPLATPHAISDPFGWPMGYGSDAAKSLVKVNHVAPPPSYLIPAKITAAQVSALLYPTIIQPASTSSSSSSSSGSSSSSTSSSSSSGFGSSSNADGGSSSSSSTTGKGSAGSKNSQATATQEVSIKEDPNTFINPSTTEGGVDGLGQDPYSEAQTLDSISSDPLFHWPGNLLAQQSFIQPQVWVAPPPPGTGIGTHHHLSLPVPVLPEALTHHQQQRDPPKVSESKVNHVRVELSTRAPASPPNSNRRLRLWHLLRLSWPKKNFQTSFLENFNSSTLNHLFNSVGVDTFSANTSSSISSGTKSRSDSYSYELDPRTTPIRTINEEESFDGESSWVRMRRKRSITNLMSAFRSQSKNKTILQQQQLNSLKQQGSTNMVNQLSSDMGKPINEIQGEETVNLQMGWKNNTQQNMIIATKGFVPLLYNENMVQQMENDMMTSAIVYNNQQQQQQQLPDTINQVEHSNVEVGEALHSSASALSLPLSVSPSMRVVSHTPMQQDQQQRLSGQQPGPITPMSSFNVEPDHSMLIPPSSMEELYLQPAASSPFEENHTLSPPVNDPASAEFSNNNNNMTANGKRTGSSPRQRLKQISKSLLSSEPLKKLMKIRATGIGASVSNNNKDNTNKLQHQQHLAPTLAEASNAHAQMSIAQHLNNVVSPQVMIGGNAASGGGHTLASSPSSVNSLDNFNRFALPIQQWFQLNNQLNSAGAAAHAHQQQQQQYHPNRPLLPLSTHQTQQFSPYSLLTSSDQNPHVQQYQQKTAIQHAQLEPPPFTTHQTQAPPAMIMKHSSPAHVRPFNTPTTQHQHQRGQHQQHLQGTAAGGGTQQFNLMNTSNPGYGSLASSQTQVKLYQQQQQQQTLTTQRPTLISITSSPLPLPVVSGGARISNFPSPSLSPASSSSSLQNSPNMTLPAHSVDQAGWSSSSTISQASNNQHHQNSKHPQVNPTPIESRDDSNINGLTVSGSSNKLKLFHVPPMVSLTNTNNNLISSQSMTKFEANESTKTLSSPAPTSQQHFFNRHQLSLEPLMMNLRPFTTGAVKQAYLSSSGVGGLRVGNDGKIIMPPHRSTITFDQHHLHQQQPIGSFFFGRPPMRELLLKRPSIISPVSSLMLIHKPLEQNMRRASDFQIESNAAARFMSPPRNFLNVNNSNNNGKLLQQVPMTTSNLSNQSQPGNSHFEPFIDWNSTSPSHLLSPSGRGIDTGDHTNNSFIPDPIHAPHMSLNPKANFNSSSPNQSGENKQFNFMPEQNFAGGSSGLNSLGGSSIVNANDFTNKSFRSMSPLNQHHHPFIGRPQQNPHLNNKNIAPSFQAADKMQVASRQFFDNNSLASDNSQMSVLYKGSNISYTDTDTYTPVNNHVGDSEVEFSSFESPSQPRPPGATQSASSSVPTNSNQLTVDTSSLDDTSFNPLMASASQIASSDGQLDQQQQQQLLMQNNQGETTGDQLQSTSSGSGTNGGEFTAEQQQQFQHLLNQQQQQQQQLLMQQPGNFNFFNQATQTPNGGLILPRPRLPKLIPSFNNMANKFRQHLYQTLKFNPLASRWPNVLGSATSIYTRPLQMTGAYPNIHPLSGNPSPPYPITGAKNIVLPPLDAANNNGVSNPNANSMYTSSSSSSQVSLDGKNVHPPQYIEQQTQSSSNQQFIAPASGGGSVRGNNFASNPYHHHQFNHHQQHSMGMNSNHPQHYRHPNTHPSSSSYQHQQQYQPNRPPPAAPLGEEGAVGGGSGELTPEELAAATSAAAENGGGLETSTTEGGEEFTGTGGGLSNATTTTIQLDAMDEGSSVGAAGSENAIFDQELLDQLTGSNGTTTSIMSAGVGGDQAEFSLVPPPTLSMKRFPKSSSQGQGKLQRFVVPGSAVRSGKQSQMRSKPPNSSGGRNAMTDVSQNLLTSDGTYIQEERTVMVAPNSLSSSSPNGTHSLHHHNNTSASGGGGSSNENDPNKTAVRPSTKQVGGGVVIPDWGSINNLTIHHHHVIATSNDDTSTSNIDNNNNDSSSSASMILDHTQGSGDYIPANTKSLPEVPPAGDSGGGSNTSTGTGLNDHQITSGVSPVADDEQHQHQTGGGAIVSVNSTGTAHMLVKVISPPDGATSQGSETSSTDGGSSAGSAGSDGTSSGSTSVQDDSLTTTMTFQPADGDTNSSPTSSGIENNQLEIVHYEPERLATPTTTTSTQFGQNTRNSTRLSLNRQQQQQHQLQSGRNRSAILPPNGRRFASNKSLIKVHNGNSNNNNTFSYSRQQAMEQQQQQQQLDHQVEHQVSSPGGGGNHNSDLQHQVDYQVIKASDLEYPPSSSSSSTASNSTLSDSAYESGAATNPTSDELSMSNSGIGGGVEPNLLSAGGEWNQQQSAGGIGGGGMIAGEASEDQQQQLVGQQVYEPDPHSASGMTFSGHATNGQPQLQDHQQQSAPDGAASGDGSDENTVQVDTDYTTTTSDNQQPQQYEPQNPQAGGGSEFASMPADPPQQHEEQELPQQQQHNHGEPPGAMYVSASDAGFEQTSGAGTGAGELNNGTTKILYPTPSADSTDSLSPSSFTRLSSYQQQHHKLTAHQPKRQNHNNFSTSSPNSIAYDFKPVNLPSTHFQHLAAASAVSGGQPSSTTSGVVNFTTHTGAWPPADSSETFKPLIIQHAQTPSTYNSNNNISTPAAHKHYYYQQQQSGNNSSSLWSNNNNFFTSNFTSNRQNQMAPVSTSSADQQQPMVFVSMKPERVVAEAVAPSVGSGRINPAFGSTRKRPLKMPKSSRINKQQQQQQDKLMLMSSNSTSSTGTTGDFRSTGAPAASSTMFGNEIRASELAPTTTTAGLARTTHLSPRNASSMMHNTYPPHEANNNINKQTPGMYLNLKNHNLNPDNSKTSSSSAGSSTTTAPSSKTSSLGAISRDSYTQAPKARVRWQGLGSGNGGSNQSSATSGANNGTKTGPSSSMEKLMSSTEKVELTSAETYRRDPAWLVSKMTHQAYSSSGSQTVSPPVNQVMKQDSSSSSGSLSVPSSSGNVSAEAGTQSTPNGTLVALPPTIKLHTHTNHKPSSYSTAPSSGANNDTLSQSTTNALARSAELNSPSPQIAAEENTHSNTKSSNSSSSLSNSNTNSKVFTNFGLQAAHSSHQHNKIPARFQTFRSNVGNLGAHGSASSSSFTIARAQINQLQPPPTNHKRFHSVSSAHLPHTPSTSQTDASSASNTTAESTGGGGNNQVSSSSSGAIQSPASMDSRTGSTSFRLSSSPSATTSQPIQQLPAPPETGTPTPPSEATESGSTQVASSMNRERPTVFSAASPLGSGLSTLSSVATLQHRHHHNPQPSLDISSSSSSRAPSNSGTAEESAPLVTAAASTRSLAIITNGFSERQQPDIGLGTTTAPSSVTKNKEPEESENKQLQQQQQSVDTLASTSAPSAAARADLATKQLSGIATSSSVYSVTAVDPPPSPSTQEAASTNSTGLGEKEKAANWSSELDTSHKEAVGKEKGLKQEDLKEHLNHGNDDTTAGVMDYQPRRDALDFDEHEQQFLRSLLASDGSHSASRSAAMRESSHRFAASAAATAKESAAASEQNQQNSDHHSSSTRNKDDHQVEQQLANNNRQHEQEQNLQDNRQEHDEFVSLLNFVYKHND